MQNITELLQHRQSKVAFPSLATIFPSQLSVDLFEMNPASHIKG